MGTAERVASCEDASDDPGHGPEIGSLCNLAARGLVSPARDPLDRHLCSRPLAAPPLLPQHVHAAGLPAGGLPPGPCSQYSLLVLPCGPMPGYWPWLSHALSSTSCGPARTHSLPWASQGGAGPPNGPQLHPVRESEPWPRSGTPFSPRGRVVSAVTLLPLQPHLLCKNLGLSALPGHSFLLPGPTWIPAGKRGHQTKQEERCAQKPQENLPQAYIVILIYVQLHA